MIIQFVSVFITLHLYTLSCVFLLLHSVRRVPFSVGNVPGNSDKVYIPAPTIWAHWIRFYNLLPVTLWVKKNTISASTISLKAIFLVKSKQFLYLLLLLIFVSRVTDVTHFYLFILFSPSSHLYDIGHISHNIHQITILKTLNFNYTVSNSSVDTYHNSIVDKKWCIEANTC